MKNLILAVVAVISINTFAADELVNTFNCSRYPAVPDLGLGVQVQEGGIIGATQVHISQFFLGHSKTELVIGEHTNLKKVQIVDRATHGKVMSLFIDPIRKLSNGKMVGSLMYKGQTTGLACTYDGEDGE